MREQRVARLDGVRALAILAVVLVHWVGTRVGVGRGGYIGVDVFFVLSGYVITRSLVRRPVTYREFMKRRLLRLYPALLAVVSVGSVVCVALGQTDGLRGGAVAAVTQVSSVWAAAGGNIGPFGITWSLAVEWYFYLLWPLALPWVTRQHRPARFLVGAAGVLYLVALSQPAGVFYFGPVARFPEIMIGCSLALGIPRMPRGAGYWLVAAAGVWVVAGPSELSPLYRWVGLPLGVLAAVALIVNGAPGLSSLAPVGRASYSLYLWHAMPIAWLENDGMARGPKLAIIATLAVVATWVSYRLLELPAMRAPREATRGQNVATSAT